MSCVCGCDHHSPGPSASNPMNTMWHIVTQCLEVYDNAGHQRTRSVQFTSGKLVTVIDYTVWLQLFAGCLHKKGLLLCISLFMSIALLQQQIPKRTANEQTEWQNQFLSIRIRFDFQLHCSWAKQGTCQCQRCQARTRCKSSNSQQPRSQFRSKNWSFCRETLNHLVFMLASTAGALSYVRLLQGEEDSEIKQLSDQYLSKQEATQLGGLGEHLAKAAWMLRFQ